MKIYLFKKTVLDCKQATLLSLKKEEGKASILERVKLFYHLLYCIYCRRFIKQSSIINHIGKGVVNSIFTHPPHTLSAKLKEDIQQQIDNPGQ
jgi:L-lactate utilization protein LutB